MAQSPSSASASSSGSNMPGGSVNKGVHPIVLIGLVIGTIVTVKLITNALKK